MGKTLRFSTVTPRVNSQKTQLSSLKRQIFVAEYLIVQDWVWDLRVSDKAQLRQCAVNNRQFFD